MSDIIERGIDSLHAYAPLRLAVKSSHPRVVVVLVTLLLAAKVISFFLVSKLFNKNLVDFIKTRACHLRNTHSLSQKEVLYLLKSQPLTIIMMSRDKL